MQAGVPQVFLEMRCECRDPPSRELAAISRCGDELSQQIKRALEQIPVSIEQSRICPSNRVDVSIGRNNDHYVIHVE